jgi:SPP1 gp7 family putative phage head morphogenesis protein
MNRFRELEDPTAEMLLSLLEDAYEDQVIIDNLLYDFFEELVDDFEELFDEFEEDEELILGEPTNLRDHPRVYQEILKQENELWGVLAGTIMIAMTSLIGSSMQRTYTNSMTRTYQLFEPYIPQAQILRKEVPVKITDTYFTSNILPIPWCQDGKLYSQRLYGHVAQFQSKLNFVLEKGIKEGKGYDWMVQAWRKLTGSLAYDAARLIKTETVAMWSQATKAAYLNMGIVYIEIVGDAACGQICTDYVGEVIPLRDAELGDELPPYHPNCACSYIAYEEVADEEIEVEVELEMVND